MTLLNPSSTVTYIGQRLYILDEDVTFDLPWAWAIFSWETEFISLKKGLLTIRAGFRFNGSTFVGDTPSTLSAALIHDVLYTLLDLLGLTFFEHYRLRKSADKLYRRYALLKGAKAWRINLRYFVLRILGR